MDDRTGRKKRSIVISHMFLYPETMPRFYGKKTNIIFWIQSEPENGVLVNNMKIVGKEKLHEKDVITITNSKLIFTKTMIFYCCYKNGVSVDASDIVIRRGKGRKAFITSNHVSLNIRPGELIAIIGGSGAGKSTILNCMCGYLRPTRGSITSMGIICIRTLTQ